MSGPHEDVEKESARLSKEVRLLRGEWEVLKKHGFKVSMSGKGNCYDKSIVETFFKSIKAELIWRNRWETRRQAEGAIFQYINGFYNPRRRHSSLGGKSPLAFERKAA
jgi:transposase InsO family protein